MHINKKASILIITIWVLNTLAIYAVCLGNIVRQRILIIGRIEDNEELHSVCEAGVKQALAEFGKYQAAFNNLGRNCRDNPDIFKDISLGKGRFAVSYTYHDWNTDTSETHYGFQDEQSKININRAPLEVLTRLFQNIAGLDDISAQKLTNAVIDYRDEDTVSREGLDEEFYYQEKSSTYKLKNTDFEIIDEIKLVRGMSEEIFQRIKDYITIYGLGSVNINTASGQALEVIGLPKNLVSKIIAFRCGKDEKEGTFDDNITDDLSGYVESMQNIIPMSEQEKQVLSELMRAGILFTRSTCIVINSRARLKNKNKIMDITCVYDRGKIPYWREKIYTE